MRSALTVTAAAAALLVAAAAPAGAAELTPYCTVTLVATTQGKSSSCVGAWPGANGLVIRTLDFHVSAGLVTATVTCGPATKSLTVAAPFTGSITLTQPRDSSCSNTLRADSPIATAAGLSTYFVTHV